MNRKQAYNKRRYDVDTNLVNKITNLSVICCSHDQNFLYIPDEMLMSKYVVETHHLYGTIKHYFVKFP